MSTPARACHPRAHPHSVSYGYTFGFSQRVAQWPAIEPARQLLRRACTKRKKFLHCSSFRGNVATACATHYHAMHLTLTLLGIPHACEKDPGCASPVLTQSATFSDRTGTMTVIVSVATRLWNSSYPHFRRSQLVAGPRLLFLPCRRHRAYLASLSTVPFDRRSITLERSSHAVS